MNDPKCAKVLFDLLTQTKMAINEFKRLNGDLLKDGNCDDGRDFGVDSLIETVGSRIKGDAVAWNKFVEDWKTNGKEMEGWLLELQNENGEWYAEEVDLNCEFSEWPELDFHTVDGAPASFNALSLSDSWDERLGVGWSKYWTPEHDPHESGIWGGECSEFEAGFKGQLWRVTKIKFTSCPSENLLKAIEENPDFRVRF